VHVPQKSGPANGEHGRQQEHRNECFGPHPVLPVQSCGRDRGTIVGIELLPVDAVMLQAAFTTCGLPAFEEGRGQRRPGQVLRAVPTKPVQIDDVRIPDGRHPLAQEADEDPARCKREQPDHYDAQQHKPKSGRYGRQVAKGSNDGLGHAGYHDHDEKHSDGGIREPTARSQAIGQVPPGRESLIRTGGLMQKHVGASDKLLRQLSSPAGGHRLYGPRPAMFRANSRTRRMSSSVAKVLSIR